MQQHGPPAAGRRAVRRPAVPPLERQALHAQRLAFTHPVDGTPLAFVSALPQDLRDALQEQGLRYNETVC